MPQAILATMPPVPSPSVLKPGLHSYIYLGSPLLSPGSFSDFLTWYARGANSTVPYVICPHMEHLEVKSVETEGRSVVARGWEREKWGATALWARVSFGGDDKGGDILGAEGQGPPHHWPGLQVQHCPIRGRVCGRTWSP